MKLIKKFFVMIAILFTTFTMTICIETNKETIQAETIQDVSNNLYKININTNDDVDISNIEFERYIAVPNYSNGKVMNYSHTYYDTISYNSIDDNMEKISDSMYLKIKLDTLPSGYGVTNRGYFLANNQACCDFSIYKVEKCSMLLDEFANLDIKFFTTDDVELYLNYTVNAELINEHECQVNVLTDFKVYNKIINIEGLNNQMIGEDSLENSFSNNVNSNYSQNSLDLPFEVEYDNYGYYRKDSFVIVYNIDTMNYDNILKIGQSIVDINQFFCVNADTNFLKPETLQNGEYIIYLTHLDDINNTQQAYGYTYLLDSSLRTSYIELKYEIIDGSILGNNRKDAYLMILAHEYFHAICMKYGVIHNKYNMLSWMQESFGTWAGLVYMNSIKYGENVDIYTFNQYNGRYRDFLATSMLSLDDCSINDRQYALFFFPLYIYQLYGYSGIKEVINNYQFSTSKFDCFEKMLASRNITLNEFYESFVVYNSHPFLEYDLIDYEYKKCWDYEWVSSVGIPIDEFIDTVCIDYSLPYYSHKLIRYKAPTVCNEYDMYYTIESTNSVPISIYKILRSADNTKDVYKIEYTNNIVTIPILYDEISSEIYDYSFLLINSDQNSNVSNVTTSLTINHRESNIELNQMVDVNNHLHSNKIEYMLKFVAPETAMYEIETKVIAKNNNQEPSYRQGLIRIFNKNKELMNKYDSENVVLRAENGISCKNVVVCLEKGETYYINPHPKGLMFNHYYITVKEVESFNNDVSFIDMNYPNMVLEQGDNFYKINILQGGRFKFKISAKSNNEVVKRNLYLVFFSKKGDNWLYKNGTVIESTDTDIEFNTSFYPDREYYIGIFNCQEGYTFNINSNIETFDRMDLRTDLNSNATVGTEVTLNGGAYYGKIITEGYSRVIYPYIYNEIQSRLDYDWYSLDESKAYVTKYGTVVAKKIEKEYEKVKILAVKKDNPYFSSIIEFMICKDKSNTIKNLKLTTDVREGGTITGTEVSENGGAVGDVVIHVGYTRLICINDKNSPSNSIQDYIWSSSDDSIATVSQYGTIKAISMGSYNDNDDNWAEVEITGIYKYNENFVAKIIIKVKN